MLTARQPKQPVVAQRRRALRNESGRRLRVGLVGAGRYAVEHLRVTMAAVATGGPRIDSVNDEYRDRRFDIKRDLSKLGLEDPNLYDDLWDWYGKWSSDLQTYRSRRLYLREIYAPLIRQLEAIANGAE